MKLNILGYLPKCSEIFFQENLSSSQALIIEQFLISFPCFSLFHKVHCSFCKSIIFQVFHQCSTFRHNSVLHESFKNCTKVCLFLVCLCFFCSFFVFFLPFSEEITFLLSYLTTCPIDVIVKYLINVLKTLVDCDHNFEKKIYILRKYISVFSLPPQSYIMMKLLVILSIIKLNKIIINPVIIMFNIIVLLPSLLSILLISQISIIISIIVIIIIINTIS